AVRAAAGAEGAWPLTSAGGTEWRGGSSCWSSASGPASALPRRGPDAPADGGPAAVDEALVARVQMVVSREGGLDAFERVLRDAACLGDVEEVNSPAETGEARQLLQTAANNPLEFDPRNSWSPQEPVDVTRSFMRVLMDGIAVEGAKRPPLV